MILPKSRNLKKRTKHASIFNENHQNMINMISNVKISSMMSKHDIDDQNNLNHTKSPLEDMF